MQMLPLCSHLPLVQLAILRHHHQLRQSSSSSSETVYDEALGKPDGIGTGIGMDEMFVTKFKSLDVMEQEEAVILLRKTTRANDEDARVRLCTPKLLQAIKPLLVSRYPIVQTNAVASIVNLSLANVNKVKIVRSGMVPILVDLLKGGFEESQEHAAGGIFSLALQDENKMAIGVLRALDVAPHFLIV